MAHIIPKCKDWVVKKNKPGTNKHYPFCLACSIFLEIKKFSLKKHAERATHSDAMKKFADAQLYQNALQRFITPVDDKVTPLTVRIALSIAYNHLPICYGEEMIDIFRKEVETPAINQVHVGRTRFCNVTRQDVIRNQIDET